ncbi:MAG: ribosome biogenesis GTPase Der [Thermodesulfovibrionales bacterium]|nr:ribosome biogenesis GTPase Der [Thermodesulfovibrionales bacterium]
MKLPLVAIVGRPNAGKSTLFNRIIRQKKAITEKTPGVTRDRIEAQAEWDGRRFILVDTGGFTDIEDTIMAQVRKQALFAIDEADVVIHLLDSKTGATPEDMELMRFLREKNKKTIFAVNKIDTPSKKDLIYEFYKLGDEPMPLSAQTGYGIEELMERVLSLLPEKKEKETVILPKIAIVGRPNTGKSTLVNTLLGKERMIVSPEPGTTRDSVDSICRYYGKEYILIDTAGIRRKARIEDSIEFYSVTRAMRSIERADVVILLLDALEGITDQDQKIAGLIRENNKSAIVAFNKWDKVEEPDKRLKFLLSEFQRKLPHLDYAPILTISGLEKKRVTKIFPLIDEILAERKKRITTGELNRILKKIKEELMVPAYKGKEVKIYYLTQAETEPPGFVLFVNFPQAIKEHHKKYIENLLRESFGFKGSPVKIYIRESR